MDYKSLDTETFDHLVSSIVKGLAYKENGGKVDLNNIRAGKTGEMKSIFQFLPATWKGYAKEVLGDENAPLNNENETKVVHEKVSKWLKEGRNVKQIASMWNAGTGEPDAWDGTFKATTKTHKAGDPSKGILKKSGVAYDVPTYARDVEDYSKKFFDERMANKMPTPNPAAVSEVPDEPKQNKMAKANDILSDFVKKLAGGGIQKASAMEKPDQTNPATMPLMQPNAPQEQPVKTETAANMPGLLGR